MLDLSSCWLPSALWQTRAELSIRTILDRGPGELHSSSRLSPCSDLCLLTVSPDLINVGMREDAFWKTSTITSLFLMTRKKSSICDRCEMHSCEGDVTALHWTTWEWYKIEWFWGWTIRYCVLDRQNRNHRISMFEFAKSHDQMWHFSMKCITVYNRVTFS